MPSAHRRVGLVVDDGVASALGALREQAPTVTADAALVRLAVLDGAALHALIAAAAGANDAAITAVAALRNALVHVPSIPPDLSAHVLKQIEQAQAVVERAARRERQRALLRRAPAQTGTAVDLKERLDAFDPLADG